MAAQAIGYTMVAETLSYIACDVPEGMQLGSWRTAQRTRRGRRFRVPGLRRRSALRAQPAR
jgi:hypothetical protein